MTDIYKTPQTQPSQYRQRPGLRAGSGSMLKGEATRNSLWIGISVLAITLVLAIAFAAWLFQTRPS